MNGTNEYTVYLALGSNLGDKQKNIEEALDKIEERIGSITSLSAFYLTSPVGFQSESIFVNCVCEVITHLNIYELFAITQGIEKEIGRSHKSKNGQYADRIIDIDLILAGNLVIDTPELTVPHPRFHTRSFVLDPLYEIAPDLIHPLLEKPIRQLRDELHREQSGD
ncbi:2-amino-4-hydroxy-6-hydroxymethyldihydropteridine diphosphokinase [Proteiniphilum acetatigenes]|uniref:2-amino-4-hydroxy-6- hydroxymethyldihydropteridine diphosphokinase n=1 Tax=Proteiniphilum acetatigenes TaxID=294710 RepID=UPI000382BE0A|nr:2-amino-4-hydroxy-6-hydroxymethyldihydropteridine diphosphokinase [Proteiniphilum acetatigenes]SFL01043.1 2-amino-4-hydroxy-6-hydroxymethyldihydropteridinediphosphokinase [Porphyromonadaceae bacterium KH3CP3RA]